MYDNGKLSQRLQNLSSNMEMETEIEGGFINLCPFLYFLMGFFIFSSQLGDWRLYLT